MKKGFCTLCFLSPFFLVLAVLWRCSQRGVSIHLQSGWQSFKALSHRCNKADVKLTSEGACHISSAPFSSCLQCPELITLVLSCLFYVIFAGLCCSWAWNVETRTYSPDYRPTETPVSGVTSVSVFSRTLPIESVNHHNPAGRHFQTDSRGRLFHKRCCFKPPRDAGDESKSLWCTCVSRGKWSGQYYAVRLKHRLQGSSHTHL